MVTQDKLKDVKAELEAELEDARSELSSASSRFQRIQGALKSLNAAAEIIDEFNDGEFVNKVDGSTTDAAIRSV